MKVGKSDQRNADVHKNLVFVVVCVTIFILWSHLSEKALRDRRTLDVHNLDFKLLRQQIGNDATQTNKMFSFCLLGKPKIRNVIVFLIQFHDKLQFQPQSLSTARCRGVMKSHQILCPMITDSRRKKLRNKV